MSSLEQLNQNQEEHMQPVINTNDPKAESLDGGNRTMRQFTDGRMAMLTNEEYQQELESLKEDKTL